MGQIHQLSRELTSRKEAALLGGGTEKISAQHNKGLMTARERIEKFIDKDSFMELGMLNTSDIKGMEYKSYGDGLIAGLEKVNGRPAVIEFKNGCKKKVPFC